MTRMKRPITSLDFCYSGESETVSVQVFFSSSRFQKTGQEFKISGVCLDLRDGGGLRLRNNACERDVDSPRCYPSSFSQANRSRQENWGDRAFMFCFLKWVFEIKFIYWSSPLTVESWQWLMWQAKEMRDLIQQLSNTMKTILHNR